MSFERPFALALLAAIPLLLLLHRRRSGAHVVRVASLLAFRGAGTHAPSAAPRRRFDWPVALAIAAILALAFGAAEPRWGAARSAFYVVVDRSVSTTARTCDAERRADALLREAAPDADRVVQDLGPGAVGPSTAAGVADGLPGTLAPHLAAASSQGFPGLVLVTDADLEPMPGVAVVGPSVRARTNVSVAAAVLDGAQALVSLWNHGDEDVRVVLRAETPAEALVPARGVTSVRVAAPPPGGSARFEIASPADDLAADDRLDVRRTGGVRRLTLDASAPCPRLTAALDATGGMERAGGVDVVVTYRGGGARPGGPVLAVVPLAGTRVGGIRAEASQDESVLGASVVGRGGFTRVLPASGTKLVAPTRLAGGEPAWSDGGGGLAAAGDDLVVLAVDPEDGRSDWHRDPSFAAFLAAALDRLAGGPDRLESPRAVPPAESDVVRTPARTASIEQIRAVLRPRAAAGDGVRPAGVLAAAGALLVAASWWTAARRTARDSRAA